MIPFCVLLRVLLSVLIGWQSQALAATSDAAELQDLQSIQLAAQQFIEEKRQLADDETMQIKIGHLDSRLRLPACKTKLNIAEASQTQRLGARTLLVKCMDAQPWQIYLSASVQITKPIVVANKPLHRGEVITANMLMLDKINIAKLRYGYFTDPTLVIGQTVKLAVSMGSPITPKMVESPTLIKRGQLVEIVAVGRGIEVRQKGKALNDGALGDLVSVKNLTSKRTVEGQVSAAGMIKVKI